MALADHGNTTSRQDARRPATRKASLLHSHPRLLLLVLVLLFVWSFAIRMYLIDAPAMEFYSMRQYYSAEGARCMYYSSLKSIPEWQKEWIASYPERNSRMMVPLPTIEGIAFVLYRVAGGEHLWLPRAFSALAYVLGGVVLYFLARKLIGVRGALFAAGFYLLLPVAVLASRSFQAEPLMVAAMILSIYTVVAHNKQPTTRHLATAALVSAAAITIRPVCAFMIFGAFGALAIQRLGLRRAVLARHSWLFASVAVLPTAILFVCDHFLLSGGGASYLTETTWQPHLLLTASFYWGWVNYATGVFSVPVLGLLGGVLLLGAAFAGTFMLPKGTPRALVLGMWLGYVTCCVVYAYHISNHHYFHLQLVPLVSLCLAPVAIRAISFTSDLISDFVGRGLTTRVIMPSCVIAVVLLFSFGSLGTINAYKVEYEQLPSTAAEIGRLVDHSTRTVILGKFYGNELTYHGWFLGHMWPHTYDFDLIQTRTGLSPSRGEELFYAQYSGKNPDYFVVADMEEFERQPELKEFLEREFPVLAHSEEYVIFDLRNPYSTPVSGE